MTVEQYSKFYVYLHRRKSDNELFYVGKGCGLRAKQSAGRTTYWQRIVKKHGLVIEIVAEGLTEQEALDLEESLIKKHHLKLCNFQKRGDKHPVYSFSEEAKEKISKANTGKKRTPEQLEKARAIRNTDEYRQKMRAAVNHDYIRQAHREAAARRRGQPLSEARRKVIDMMNSPEIREKVSKTRSDPEFRKKLAAAISKATKGRGLSNHILEAAKKATQKAIRCIETGQVFDAIADARRWLQANGWPKAGSTALRYCASGQRGYKQAYGYRWQYVNE
jgi:hypothetical protein